MEIDMHYQATYLAARLAGFDKPQATTIAHAAQYVDESDMSQLQDKTPVSGSGTSSRTPPCSPPMS